MKCKYTLRSHLQVLVDYYEYLDKCKNIDTYKKIRIKSNLRKRINSIKEYLNIDKEVYVKKSFNEIFKSNLKYIKEE